MAFKYGIINTEQLWIAFGDAQSTYAIIEEDFIM